MRNALIFCTALLASTFAHADGQTDYQMNVGRVNGSLQCTFNHTAESFDCNLHVAGQKHLTIDMKAKQNKKGDTVAFIGIDKQSDNGQNFSLVVMAGADKQMHGISMISDNHANNNPVFNASVASSCTQALHAASISPIAIDATDMSAIKVSLNFVVYAAADDALIQSANSDDMTNFLIEKIQPYLQTLDKN